jgi:thiol-disulfide isomerase/thioredoxin
VVRSGNAVARENETAEELPMPRINETIYAPAIDGGEWIQHGPVNLRDLRGKSVALIDFWDYTCVNCIRTLPYVAQWHRRYARHGLVTIGVHAPEFSFARDHANVRAAIERFGLEYPIVLDNDYAIWRAYSNRCWPAKYLVDAQGRLRYYHFGEGLYQETEAEIQRLLGEIDPSLDLPPLMAAIRDADRPGAVCYRVTPELYLGYQRGQFGNPAGVAQDRAVEYRDSGPHAEGAAYLGGRWTVGAESSRADEAGATLALRYTSKDVNLVMAADGAASAEIILGEGQQPGADVRLDGGRMVVTVDSPRMYALVENESVAAGALRLRALDAGLSVFAFTFISCVAE